MATPELVAPTFARTVVLLLAHSEEGALGVVLNRPGGLDVTEVLPDWAPLAAEPAQVFVGGPVQPDTAMCLGATSNGWRVVDRAEDPQTTEIGRVRVVAGYAGWAPGQLESEIEARGWYVVEGLPGDPFDPEPESLWRRVLRRQGGQMALASTSPDDPRMN